MLVSSPCYSDELVFTEWTADFFNIPCSTQIFFFTLSFFNLWIIDFLSVFFVPCSGFCILFGFVCLLSSGWYMGLGNWGNLPLLVFFYWYYKYYLKKKIIFVVFNSFWYRWINGAVTTAQSVHKHYFLKISSLWHALIFTCCIVLCVGIIFMLFCWYRADLLLWNPENTCFSR